MEKKKVYDIEEMMIDYGEMTSFDFKSMTFKEMQDLQKITDSEYVKIPSGFKYGKFDIVDLFHSFISQKD